MPAASRVLSSVRVLGEGVDTAECDAVLFADARGSMIDIVQMVGRALRMQPGSGKLATLIVPLFLEPDEDANQLLTSDAYGTLAKVLGALRAHDTDTIEALANPSLRDARLQVERDGDDGQLSGVVEGQRQGEEDSARVSERAAGVLRFMEERGSPSLARRGRHAQYHDGLSVLSARDRLLAANGDGKATGMTFCRSLCPVVTCGPWRPPGRTASQGERRRHPSNAGSVVWLSRICRSARRTARSTSDHPLRSPHP